MEKDSIPEDTLAVAVHDLFTNEYSDLVETKRLDQTIERFMNSMGNKRCLSCYYERRETDL